MSEQSDLAGQRSRLMSHHFEPLVARPAIADVRRMVLIPFVNGLCVLIRQPDGRLCVPEWQEGIGRNYLHGAYLAPLEQAGVRLQQIHLFARNSGDARVVAGWIDGELRETQGSRLVVAPEEAIMRLQEQGNPPLAALVQWATDSFRNQTEASYYEDLQVFLEEAYLAATTVYGGSGFGGDAAQWRLARGIIAEALHKDGTFLDIGCANGLLMESMVAWAAEKGYRLEPYGLDISARLAEVARHRLPQWADRIFVGNVMFWEPPKSFDFVRTGLEYVPEPRRADLVHRLLTKFVAPGGRLIVAAYGLTKDPAKASWSVGDHLRSFGLVVGGEPEQVDRARGRLYRIAYLDKAEG
ncbi:MAG TPA: methyltransferase domain-containing protein [Caldilineaceae bacterium]|nr:methyltransferase domain-containing protein [Caldilineaceae bacterium]